MKNRLHTTTLTLVAAALAGHAGAEGPTATELLNHDALGGVQMGEHTLIENFPLADAGRFTFDVERFSVLAPGARIVEQDGDTVRDIPDTNLVLLRGTIVGEDDNSSVFLSVGQWGINGVVTRGEEFFSISSGPYTPIVGPNSEVIVTSNLDLDYINQNFCQYDPANPALNPVVDPRDADAQPLFNNTLRGVGGCNLAPVAVDTDYEFTNNRFGGNSSASSDYAQTLFGAASSIYERDVDVTITIAFLRTYSTNTDPYSGNLNNFLDQVRTEWRTNMTGVSRVIVHGMSGRNLGGGVAYLGVLCNTNLGYGVSAVNGFFPNPPQDHHNSNWDIIVVPHEMGHNFGSGHTHDGYNPPIDGCGNGNCTGAFGGTIMSYCHLCGGGIRNIVLAFHDRVQTVIENRVNNAGCITSTGDEFVALDDTASTVTGIPVTIEALVNDASQSCGTPEFQSVQTPTPNGGTVVVQNDSPFDTLRYTPPVDLTSGIDTFTYTLVGGSTATVTVTVAPMRPGDNPSNPLPGVEVDYYLLTSPTQLPDFGTLTPLNSDVVPNIDYPATTGIFATGFLGNNVGAVFEGFVQVSIPGIYTFETESDDGSRLWIGDTLVVDNDGVHGMETVEGQIGLLTGLHRTRVEFFESTGSAGLIVRSALGSATPLVIPANRWFYSTEVPCIADWNDDGELNFFDVQGFLGSFSAQDNAADLNEDGTFDFFDVQAYLGLFAAGCP